MTTHELATLLLAQPNIKCCTYIQDAEEYGTTTSVHYYAPDDYLPYAKGDKPENPTGMVLIEGWPA